MKTKEELNALKEEAETLNKKLAELSEEELAQVSGGVYQGPGTFVCSNSSCELSKTPLVTYGYAGCHRCGSELIQVGDRHGNLW